MLPYPRKNNLLTIFSRGLRALKTYVLLSFLWSISVNGLYQCDPTNIGNSSTHNTKLIGYFPIVLLKLLYEGRSIGNENSPVNPKVLYLHTS